MHEHMCTTRVWYGRTLPQFAMQTILFAVQQKDIDLRVPTHILPFSCDVYNML